MTDIEYLKKYLDNDKLNAGIKRLENGEPVQYIVGHTDFYGLNFIINKDVLIPRFETEELVEKTINYIKKYFENDLNIIDLGTGSGCIAITLKTKINACVDAVDISYKALEVAKINAKKNDAEINFYLGNMLEPISKKYDVIISNPPYIAFDEEIMDIVKDNEPHGALYADNCGLEFYEQILKSAYKHLKKKSLIAFEIGYKQGNDIINIAKKYFPNSNIILDTDLQKKDRFIFIFNNV
ncbi:MAG: peptide chain release factor N(5)-glutamine methyltransferase [Bacilli bacterium]